MTTDKKEQLDAEPRTALLLVVITVIGVGIGYATSILAARMLGPIGFDDYAVAIATLGILSSVSEMGVGKYALKVLPGFRISNQWSLASGYWRYSLGLTLLASLALVAMVLGWTAWREPESVGAPLAVVILFLPAAAMSGVGVDFVMANRAAVSGAVIARLVVPGTTLLLLATATLLAVELSVPFVITLYGSGCVVGALLCVRYFRRTSPPEYFSAAPRYEASAWTRQCIYFAAFALLATALFRVSILVLEALPIDEIQVALMAAAMDTGCLILLMAKSTDKLFQPQLSIIIEQADWEEGRRIRSKRYWLIGAACAGFLLIIFFFGKQILGLYGEKFIGAYPALCFVSVGTSAWTLFSLAPAFLHFRGKSVFVLTVTAISAVAILLLTAGLGLAYGATGAGAAFCIVLVCTASILLVRASKDFARLKQQ